MAKTVTVSVRVSPAIERELRAAAAREGVEFSDFVRRALADAVAWRSADGGRLQVVA